MSMRLTDSQRQLAEDNIPLVKHLVKANRKKWMYVDYDEFYSASLLALTKAAGAFDPTSGHEFSALVTRCLVSEWHKVAAQRHYIQIPQHYEDGRVDPSKGFPADREKAKRVEREGNTDRDGVCRLASAPAPSDHGTWAYELTARLPHRHRQIAERVLIQGEQHSAVQADLGIGSTNYEALRRQTKQILTRLITRDNLNAV